MIRRYLAPIALLLLLLGTAEWASTRIAHPPTDLEEGSERIGWSAASETEAIARDVFDRVNDERIERGLPPLVWHGGLADIARRWSEEMIATGYRHSPVEWRAHPDFAMIGENIFMGPRSSTELHVGWMESDGHRDALLHPGFTAVGIGVVCRNDWYMWATQIFGMPHGGSTSPVERTEADPIVRPDQGLTCDDDPWAD